MITKSELEKMVDEAFKDFCSGTPYTFDSYSSVNLFKSGASFMQGILMPEVEAMRESRELAIEANRLNFEKYIAACNETENELSTITAKVKRYEEALEYISRGKIPASSIKENYIDEHYENIALHALNQKDDT